MTDNDPFHPNHPLNRGPVLPERPNRHARRAEQAKARRNRAVRRLPQPRTLPPDVQGNHVQLAQAETLLSALNAQVEQMHESELDKGQLLTVLIERAAAMFENGALSIDRIADLLARTLEIAQKHGAFKELHRQIPCGDRPAGDGVVVPALLQRMLDRGPALRATLEQNGEIPMPNFIVMHLMIKSLELHSRHQMQQPSPELLDVSADILWLCRGLAFCEGLLGEPDVAQA